MDESLGSKLKKTAEAVMANVGELAQKTGEQLIELRALQRIDQQTRDLEKEKNRCRNTMADLLIRMFDQNTFAEALMRPEYERIKAIDVQLAALAEEKASIAAMHAKAVAPETETPAAEAEPEE
jgi:transposase